MRAVRARVASAHGRVPGPEGVPEPGLQVALLGHTAARWPEIASTSSSPFRGLAGTLIVSVTRGEVARARWLRTGASHFKKYCSDACRKCYQPKRERDPKNYVTFDCETCGKETTRYRKYGNGANRFCSNECAAKWTRKVRHIGIKDADVVLDSGWEALVWGWATFCKLPIERVDRTLAVPVGDGWYAPDFRIDGEWVEVKGLEGDDDPARWLAWEARHGKVVWVFDQDALTHLVNTNRLIDVLFLRFGSLSLSDAAQLQSEGV